MSNHPRPSSQRLQAESKLRRANRDSNRRSSRFAKSGGPFDHHHRSSPSQNLPHLSPPAQSRRPTHTQRPQSSHLFDRPVTGIPFSTASVPTPNITASSHISSAPVSAPASTTDTTTSRRPRGYPKPLGLGRGFPLLRNGRYVYSRPSLFVIEPGLLRRASHAYEVKDRHGDVAFTVSPRRAGLHVIRTMTEGAEGRKLLKVKGFLLSARATMTVGGADGRELLLLQRSSVMGAKRRVVRGTVNGKHALVVKVDSKRTSFVFKDGRSNEIANMVRKRGKSRHSPSQWVYRVYVSPGYDVALFLMCMVCMLDTWND